VQTSSIGAWTYWEIPPVVTCALAIVSLIYVRGWLALRRTRPSTLPVSRLAAFLGGILALFVAVASPLDTFSGTLLFMHMAQHFVLMCVAPPLIVIGSPSVPLLRGLPRFVVRKVIGPIIRLRFLHELGNLVLKLPIVWLLMNLSYICWHVPKAYEFALSNEGWHEVEHLCFFVTSVLFWWPIIMPWPSRQKFSSWMLIPYLLLSDLVNTALSAFFCFSGRLIYPSYGQVTRPFGIDALQDQIAAGSFMWVFGSLDFLLPAMFLTLSILKGQRDTPPVSKAGTYRAALR
jgi:putative membrane protein